MVRTDKEMEGVVKTDRKLDANAKVKPTLGLSRGGD
jgi:hypothetical protein